MLIVDLVVALLIATLLVAILGVGIRRLPFGTALASMFVVLFLATWAGGAWLVPVGPRVAGTAVLSFLIVGLVVALLITAIIPTHPPRTRGEALRQDEARRQAVTFLNVFFWLAVIGLLIGILARYLL